MLANVNHSDDVAIPAVNHHISKPALYVACRNDFVAVPRLQEEGMRPWVKDLKVVEMDCAHWVQLQKREELNKVLEAFLGEVETKCE